MGKGVMRKSLSDRELTIMTPVVLEGVILLKTLKINALCSTDQVTTECGPKKVSRPESKMIY